MSEKEIISQVDGRNATMPAVRSPESAAINLAETEDLYWTSLKEDTDEGKRLILLCHDEPTVKSETILNTEILVTDLLCHMAEKPDKETGEVFRFPRTVLITEGGDTIAFGAASINKSLRLISRMYGPPPWCPAMRMKILQKNMDNGHRIYRVQVTRTVADRSPASKSKAR